ncbi:MAG: hypothetical protein NW224_00635 [Leptolyngbyaceae cyanobacterium bins.302]|nr:hypothetical protein [Leptolyngbyaceae cyanobacterium bins.302]
MNIKTLLFVPGAIALSVSCFMMSPVLAQLEGAPAPAQMKRGMNQLNLTEAQKTQMKQVREETKAQIEQVLTPEQRTQMQALKQSGGKKAGGLQSLNLSEAQKQQIRQIRESSQQKMEAILTAEQRALMQQQRQNWQQRRSQIRPQPVPAQPQ